MDKFQYLCFVVLSSEHRLAVGLCVNKEIVSFKEVVAYLLVVSIAVKTSIEVNTTAYTVVSSISVYLIYHFILSVPAIMRYLCYQAREGIDLEESNLFLLTGFDTAGQQPAYGMIHKTRILSVLSEYIFTCNITNYHSFSFISTHFCLNVTFSYIKEP